VRKSLGLLEIKGLASAILVADSMAKTASITIVGIETCKGGGWQTIKVLGDVAAVQASLSTGSELAKRNDCFVAQKTLSRPDESTMKTWGTPVIAKATPVTKTIVQPTKAPELEPTAEVESTVEVERTVEDKPEVALKNEAPMPVIAEEETPFGPEENNEVEASCNLCGDPSCQRLKGEPHTKCMHYTKVK
jgi:microcompartment protein CcmL/EutN